MRMSGVCRSSREMAHSSIPHKCSLGQQSSNFIILPAGQIIRSQEVLVTQVIIPEFNVIGVDLSHRIVVLVEELIKIPQQKMGQHIDPAVLELDQPTSLLA